MRTRMVLSVLVAILMAEAAPLAQTPRRHEELVTQSGHEYAITMGGTLDGPTTRDPIGYQAWSQGFEPMRSVRIENVGEAPVVNPWIFTGQRGHWRTCAELVEHVTAPYQSELDQALALWWWETRHRWHYTTGDSTNNDPVKVWNILGHTLCGNDAHVLADCWRTAGLRTHYPAIQGHSITEVFAVGDWHLLDGDENIITLLRDNETPAAEEDIRRDHDLMKRTHTYGILRADSRQTDEFSASLYARDNQPPIENDLSSHIDHEMTFTLRPGEALVWAWDRRGKVYVPWEEGSAERVVDMIYNGWWEFTPRLTMERLAEDTESVEGLTAANGVVRAGAEGGELVYRVAAPYAIVGGTLSVGAQGQVEAALSWDGEEWVPLELSEGEHGRAADLDEHFAHAKGAMRLEYLVRLRLEPDAVLRVVSVRNDLQMAPLCMPYLELGENTIRYGDESDGPRQVRITHQWVETDENRPPAAPARPIFPADGQALNRTKFVFEWAEPPDPDGDEIADYQFILSQHRDLRWPLSPNFFKLISRTADKGTATYTVPYRGLLNPGTTYYWRVRARDGRGAWGPWSETWTFRPGGPGIPVHLARRVDKQRRTVTISWQDSSYGTRPVRYKVYGSDEKGFTVSDTEYEVWVGNEGEPQGWQTWPANLAAETTQRRLQVVGPELEFENANRAYYRVVAVDAEGVESGPSDYIAMPRPLIVTAPVTEVAGGGEYRYQPETISSLGDLRCRSIEDEGSYNAKFWDIEHPTWELAEAPRWLSIDPETGEITGTAPEEPGEHEVTVRTVIEGVGEDVQQFKLTVGPAEG
ncbi:MAG: putative Ig domain-containing protein [Armatimonadota bacterium]|nr:putative Ig domain-containing protein [Armatimonadota bacterium]